MTTITNVDNFFINITDTVSDIDVRKVTVDFEAIDGDNLPMFFDKRPVNLGRGRYILDYTTTTVGGQTPSSAAELKTLIENMIMSTTDYYMEVARGNVPGHTNWGKFGYNDDIDAAATEIIWSKGGLWTPMSSADTLDIVSDSIEDDAAGTGALTIYLQGVDENKEFQEEAITMNGTTAVTTVNSWYGINRVAVTSAGSTTWNVGNIDITATTAATTQAYIKAEDSVTQQMIFHVPSNGSSYVSRFQMEVTKTSGGGTPQVTIDAVYVLGGVRYEILPVIIDTSIIAEQDIVFKTPFKIPSGAYWCLEANSSTNNAFVRARVDQIVII